MSHGEDFDPYEENPDAHDALVVCECGREYVALVTAHDRAYDSPGWVEPEPGEEKCPTCRENSSLDPTDDSRDG